MTASETLHREHAVIRAKVELLKNALDVGPHAAFAIRELIYSISRCLAEHQAHEQTALYPVLQETLAGSQRAHAHELAHEHDRHAQLLRILHALTLRGLHMPYTRVVRIAHAFIGALERHIDEEEQLLLPILERLEVDRAARVAHSPEVRVDETMTVNRIIRMFPQTKRVFECHCVDCSREGADFLDEVAWRHAVPVKDLLHELRRATHAGHRDDEDAAEPFVAG